MKRLVNGILILAVLVGITMLMRQLRVLADLRQEHTRLSDQYGNLDIKDPNKFYILRLDTGDSKQFLWRVYRPSVNSLQYRVTNGFGGSSSGSSSSMSGTTGMESIYRYRFIVKDDQVDVHWLTIGGSSRSGFGDHEVAEFLDKHWDQLEFEFIADGEHDVDEPLRFLTIRIPDDLRTELTQGKQGYIEQLSKQPMFDVVIGTPTAFEKLDSPEDAL